MLRTRFTEVLGIKHPIMLAGMNWVTTPKLVAAVCNAGGLGVFATASCSPEETRNNIRAIRALTDKPFGVNQILNGPGAKENIAVAIAEQVPIVNYSLGKPWFVDQVHTYGGKVMGTVATVRHAVRAAQLGCDLLVITGHEAAAHGDAATSMVLVPLVASQVKVPLVAAGGFFDGRGLAAALVLGADAVSMGTRFSVTRESDVHANFKDLCLKATEQDTLYSDVFDGLPGRVLKSPGAEAMLKRGFPLVESVRSALQVRRMLHLSLLQFLGLSWTMIRSDEGRSLLMQARAAQGAVRHLQAINDGNVNEGFLFAGQAVGGINDIPTCQEVIERVVAEAEQRIKAVGQGLLPAPAAPVLAC